MCYVDGSARTPACQGRIFKWLSVQRVLGGHSNRSNRRTEGGTCQQLWDTRELHLVSLDYGGETREVGAIDVNIDQDLVA